MFRSVKKSCVKFTWMATAKLRILQKARMESIKSLQAGNPLPKATASVSFRMVHANREQAQSVLEIRNVFTAIPQERPRASQKAA